MKKCNKCQETKALSFFHRDKANQKDGRYSICKVCKKISTDRWRKNNREKYNKIYRDYNNAHKDRRRDCDYKRKYGASLEFYNSLWYRQKQACAICGKLKTYHKNHFALDHCHKTGSIRGILCYGCNRALHILDTEELLVKAQNYLRESKK